MKYPFYLVISFHRNVNGEMFDSMEIGCKSIEEVNAALDNAHETYKRLQESYIKFKIVQY